MEPITDQAALDRVTQLPSALLLKHGAHCPISANAREQVTAFAAAHPDVPVYALEVTEHAQLSRAAAERLGVRHESPQLIKLERGHVQWFTAHYDIEAGDIAERLRAS